MNTRGEEELGKEYVRSCSTGCDEAAGTEATLRIHDLLLALNLKAG